MKQKKILICYLDNLFGSVSATERLFVSLIQDMKSEGRVSRTIERDCAIFEDGSVIHKRKLESNLFSDWVRSATHLYVDEQILHLHKGEELLQKTVNCIVIPEERYLFLDAESKPEDRVKIYNSMRVEKYRK